MTDSKIDIAELITSIKAGRWRFYLKQFGTTLSDVQNDELAVLMIAANEKNRLETGADDLAKFENMTLGELTEYLDVSE